MNKKPRVLLSASILMTLLCGTIAPAAAKPLDTPEQELSSPRPAPPQPLMAPSPDTEADPSLEGSVEQAVGSYASGSLLNPNTFPLEGPGFVKLFRPRDRGWLTEDLSAVLQRASSQLRDAFPGGERLQIGDCSARGGGKISGHDSHQNGLDADVVYFRVNHQEQDPQLINGFQEIFVEKGQLTANFDLERNWKLFEVLVATGRINRLFVDPAIKRTYCKIARDQGLEAERTPVLRRLRPLVAHDDHTHVRITCPKASPRCVAQEPPPEGSGCAEVL